MYPQVEREEERGAQCVLTRPPAASEPIAASLGASLRVAESSLQPRFKKR